MFRPISEHSKLLNNYNSYIVFIHYVSYYSRSCAVFWESLSSLDLKYGCDFEAPPSQLRPIDWRTVLWYSNHTLGKGYEVLTYEV